MKSLILFLFLTSIFFPAFGQRLNKEQQYADFDTLCKKLEHVHPDLFLYQTKDEYNAKKSQMVMLVGGNFVRFIVMFLAVGLSALVIYLTNVEKEKLDYLNIIASGVPFIVNIFVASLVHIEPSQDEIKNEDNTSSLSESEISSQDKKDE